MAAAAAENMSEYQMHAAMDLMENLLSTQIAQLNHRTPGTHHEVLDPLVNQKQKGGGKSAVHGRAISSTERAKPNKRHKAKKS